jgi:hypothetical protein
MDPPFSSLSLARGQFSLSTRTCSDSLCTRRSPKSRLQDIDAGYTAGIGQKQAADVIEELTHAFSKMQVRLHFLCILPCLNL